jgi:Kef-type K+ transport system membrane component KefB
VIESAFGQIALILLVTAVLGAAAKLAKQPLIVAYIFVGIVLGPSFLDMVRYEDEIELFAELGIALLLFLVGLKLDVGLIRSIGKVAVLTGFGQVVITALIGYFLVALMGFDAIQALYISIAISFSSTIIVVKLLSDRREIDQLHGQIAVGFLIVQDLLVIVAMVVIAAIGSRTGAIDRSIPVLVIGSLVYIAAAVLVSKFVLPKVLAWLSRSQELTLLFGVSWAIGLAAISHSLGLSMEIGAFIAGVALASTPYRESLSGRMVSLRDIMILFFFIQLGSSLSFSDAIGQILPAIVISIFVLLAKPLIVMLIMRSLGYRSKVSFKTSMAIAQISEFSLILIALGFSLGQVGQAALSLVTLVAVITITLSTYLILYSDKLYERFERFWKIFEKPISASIDEDAQQARFDAIVIGSGRLGSNVVSGLLEKGARLLVVDHNPEVLNSLSNKGVTTLFGDITEPEFASSLPLNEADAVICTAQERSTNLVLLEILNRFEYEGSICLTAMDEPTAKLLEEDKKVTVIRPLNMAANRIIDALPTIRDRDK